MKTPSVCTTSWDDGHPLDLRIAELLAKYELAGTFYVPFQNSRDLMTLREMKELSGRFELGSHTIHHAVLTEVTEELANVEISESKARMEDLTGAPCESFCFPKGRFHPKHLNMVSRAGYRCARTVELLSTGFCKRTTGIYLMATSVQVSNHRWTAYAKNCAKRLAPRNFANLVLHGRSGNWLATAQSMLRSVAQHGGVFHVWGHSWEIEAGQQWSQLEAILRDMSALRTTVPCVTNSALARIKPVDAIQTSPARCDT